MAEISRTTIQEYKRKLRSEETNNRGRPARNEYRELVIKKFTMKWVASLKSSLEAKGCGTQRGLEWMVPTIQERTWRRWLNGESLPPYSTIEDLLIVKVSHGKYAGEFLYNVPVVPNHNQILTLLQFI